MDPNKKEKIFKYLQDQISQSDFRSRAYVFDENNTRNPTRNAFVKLNMHLKNFLRGNTEIRWLVVSGLRGVGKTTLLSQLYYDTSSKGIYKLYLSVDHITQILGVSLDDVLHVYEELIGSVFERLEMPLMLFLDEVQYDDKWGITLKSIYDRTRKVCIVATGSSALILQNNPDITRRAVFERLFPMCFTEYIKIKKNKFEIKGLSSKIREIIFESNNAIDVYEKLKSIQQQVRFYWTDIDRLEIDKYLSYGTLPFALKLNNEGLAYDQIKKTLDRVITTDIPQIGQFETSIISKIPEILYTIASADVLSVNGLTADLGISRITLTEILSVLEKTETLIRIYPHGSHYSQVRQPSKYLFSSPAFRAMYYNFIGSILTKENYMGKLFEDAVSLYINKLLINKVNTSLTYDSAKGGADFILRLGGENIIIEVGYGEKGFRQIQNTRLKIKSKYGLVISPSALDIDNENQIVKVPMSIFLLL